MIGECPKLSVQCLGKVLVSVIFLIRSNCFVYSLNYSLSFKIKVWVKRESVIVVKELARVDACKGHAPPIPSLMYCAPNTQKMVSFDTV